VGAPVFLITPPFTQLNTPYPATAYLKGFLNTKNIASFQADLGIDTINKVFNREGLSRLFQEIDGQDRKWSENVRHIIASKDEYLSTIDPVISFLQGKSSSLAYNISKRNFLPEASRFSNMEQLDWAFGTMGIADLSKFLCTMYLEDLSDFIRETTDEHFGFSRYAEKLGRFANSFDELHRNLQANKTYIDNIYLKIFQDYIEKISPKLVVISVPFPGNLYAAFRCAQFIKENHPSIFVALGGGFVNTELRSVSDSRVFDFFDFISLDDGEAPLEQIIAFINHSASTQDLKRTFIREENQVVYFNNTNCKDYKMSETGTPDYSGLPLTSYISALEIANPMHRLWSDGRWNKLTMAHGCYWGKCTFCDISLDYIKIYEPVAAGLICDRMEAMIKATGETGFHFVDEAAPPSLMKALALEILKRKLVVSWWTNIRFEKSFTRDLCILLRASGCIAVSGGLEVASDRLLKLIDKGITVAQVAKVNKYFTEAGIMVHAYLMYGFPTQTDQETIDSLEMVRQLFQSGVLQSAFWHQFTMTAHSPVGLNPQKFKVINKTETGNFANNDLEHIDETGAHHEKYGFGLKKSLFNYMQMHCIDDPLQKWFDFKIPSTTVDKNYISAILNETDWHPFKPGQKLIWLGNLVAKEKYTQSKKGMQREMCRLSFLRKSRRMSIEIPLLQATWLTDILEKINDSSGGMSFEQIKADFDKNGLEDFDLFMDNKPINTLYRVGLLKI
jgi:radical SAM superfamily enzyme YgiQ (UPF0313 family)